MRQVLGWISLLIMWVVVTNFYTETWGAIGFFGSLLTTPFSTVIGAVMIAFSSVEAFLGWGIWILITVALMI